MVSYTSKNYAKEILDSIGSKKVFLYERDKNLEFVKKYSLLISDIEEIIYSLDEKYFIERIENKDKKIKSKFLYVFCVLLELNNEFGDRIKKVYIKICEIESGILVVSFHESE